MIQELLPPDILFLEKKEIDFSEYKTRRALEHDYVRFVRKSTLICDKETKKVRIVYLKLTEDLSDLLEAIQSVRFSGADERTSGILSQSRIFGYRPRIVIRQDFCSDTALSRENPQAHEIIAHYATAIARYYKQFNRDLYDRHENLVGKVLPEWRIEEGIFTSGIINKNNPLPYHFDAGNFKDVWSNMLAFKKDVRGGHLACPEYGVGFEIADKSLLMFDGQNIMHGVTPIQMLSEEAYRFTIVYYSLQQMWNCLPVSDEIIRAQKLRIEKEERRYKRDEIGATYDPENWKKE